MRMRLPSGSSSSRLELVGQPAVAHEHDAEQWARIESGAGQQPQLRQRRRGHFLSLVDEQDWPQTGALQVGVPAFAQALEAAPAIVRLELDAEQLAQFAVEVGEVALRMVECGDGDVGKPLEALAEQAQRDALAGAGIAMDQGETALAHVLVLDTPEEVLDRSGDAQGFSGKLLRERVPFEPVEGEQRLAHEQRSWSVGR